MAAAIVSFQSKPYVLLSSISFSFCVARSNQYSETWLPSLFQAENF